VSEGGKEGLYSLPGNVAFACNQVVSHHRL
jgi:hypothetical protein